MSESASKKVCSVDAMNLTSVQRIDPCAVAIVDKSTHAALYSFDVEKEEWTKTEIEGPLLIYRRADKPTHSMIIANRQSLSDHIEPITPTLRIWEKSPYIFFKKTEENEIIGLWFYERDDCVRIYKLLTKLLNENSSQSPRQTSPNSDSNFDVLSLLSRAHVQIQSQHQQQQQQQQPLAGDLTPVKAKPDASTSSEIPSKNDMYEMPAMLQKLLCDENTITKRTMPIKGAINADQIEKQFMQGDNSQLLDRLVFSDPKLAPNFSSVSLTALSTTAMGGSDAGTLPDEAPSTEQSFSRNATELKRSCSVDNTNAATPLVPLNKEQLLQAFAHLIRTDDDFVVQLHRAYVDSLNYRLGL